MYERKFLATVLFAACLVGIGCPSDSEPTESNGSGDDGAGSGARAGAGAPADSEVADEVDELVDRILEAEYRDEEKNCTCVPDGEDCPARRFSTSRAQCIKDQITEIWSAEVEEELRCSVELTERESACVADASCDELETCSEEVECPDDALDGIDDCD